MTEYETLSLWASYGHIGATLLVGAIHAVLIFSGLRAMRRASDSRDRALTAQIHADERRHDEAKQQHAEAMRALDALIAGQQQQGEALRQQGEALAALVREQAEARREQGEALRQQGEALAALIARTAPTGQ